MAQKKRRGRPAAVRESVPTYAELRAWCGTVESGSFSKAAEQLRQSPATVQLLVRSLNRKVTAILGEEAKLYAYDAAERRIKPTDRIGQPLFEWAHKAVADIADAKPFIQSLGTAGRSLSVSASLGLWEAKLLAEVAKILRNNGGNDRSGTSGQRQEDRDVLFRMYARGTSASLRLLRAHRCHVVFVGEPALDSPSEPGAVASKAAGLQKRVRFQECLTVPVQLVTSRHSPLAQDPEFREGLTRARNGDAASRRKTLQRIVDSAAEPLILPGRWSVFRQHLDKLFRENSAELDANKVLELDVGRCILAAVAAGLGITIQQKLTIDPVVEPKLARFALKGIVPDWRFVAAWDPLWMTEPAKELVRKTAEWNPNPVRRS